MNILFLAPFAFTNAGGVGRVTKTLAAEFGKMGHSCLFLAACQEYKHDDIDRAVQLFMPSDQIASRENSEFLSQVVAEKKIDVVINQSATNRKILALLRAVGGHSLLISAHHGCVNRLHELHEGFVDRFMDEHSVPEILRWRFFYWLLRLRSQRTARRGFELAAQQSQHLVLLSRQLVDELESHNRQIDFRKVCAIPNPSPFLPDQSALREKENVLLYVGALARVGKRADRVLAVWSEISQLQPNWCMDIVGDGPDKEYLQDLACKMKLERITFHGERDPEPFYRKARMLLVTSDFEGFGMVIVEAQAFGCVPVSLECSSSISDLIEHDQTGLVVPHGDVNGLTCAVHMLIIDHMRLEKIAAMAVNASSKFAKERIARKWLTLMQKVV